MDDKNRAGDENHDLTIIDALDKFFAKLVEDINRVDDKNRDLTLDALSELVATESRRVEASIKAGEELHSLKILIEAQSQQLNLLIEGIREWGTEWAEHCDILQDTIKSQTRILELILLVMSSTSFSREASKLRADSIEKREADELRQTLRRQLKSHIKRLNLSREQAAKFTNPPVEMLTAIEDAEIEIEAIKAKLDDLKRN